MPQQFQHRSQSMQNQVSSKTQATNSKTTFLTLSGVATGYGFGFVDMGYENRDRKVLTNLYLGGHKTLQMNIQLEKI